MNRPDPRRGSSWGSWSLSILLHLAIVAVAVGFWLWSQRRAPPQPMAIQGGVVSQAELDARQAPPQPVVEPQVEPEPEPEPELPVEPEPEPAPEPEPPPPEEDPAVLQAEQDRLAEEARQRREAEARAESERRAREEAERQRLERERAERQKAERERQERERQERERQARERAEQQRREREQAELARREAELAAQLEAERQRAAVRGSAQARQYADLIRARVERAWVRPPSARVGLSCEVRVRQVSGGTVVNVTIGRCNGDEAVRQSIEAAVYRASPLPTPPDPALFESELIFNFAPQD